jgi:Tfp pilus assembly protein PilO
MKTEVLSILRQRRVLIAIGIALVVVLVWFETVFQSESHKLSNVNGNVQQAQSEQLRLEDRLARLKAYSKDSAKFEALEQELAAALPSSTDIYDYVTAISDAAQSTGVTVSSVDPSAPVSGTHATVIPVTIDVSGTYDQTLAFIKALYALPRLTVISQISISGGGTGTNRSTALTDQFTAEIFASSAALASSSGGS